jgi:hypothetical protein
MIIAVDADALRIENDHGAPWKGRLPPSISIEMWHDGIETVIEADGTQWHGLGGRRHYEIRIQEGGSSLT